MKRFTFSVVLLGSLGISLLIARTALTDQPSEKATSLEELQKDRIETLEEAFAIVKNQFEKGADEWNDFAKAHDELIEAKLEATDKLAERITLLEEQLKAARGLFDYAEEGKKHGLTTVLDTLRAKAHCQEIEIKLFKERNKAKSATAK
jgi:hypothetical protein